MSLILLGVWLINAFDLMLTILADAQGILHESNPIAAWVVPHGPVALTLYKMILLAPPTLVLLRYREVLLSEIAAVGAFMVYITVAIRWRMVYELYLVTNAHDYYAIPMLNPMG